MDLATARNLSLILLGVEACVLILPLGVLFFFTIKGLRYVNAQTRRFAPIARTRAAQVEQGTAAGLGALMVPLLAVASFLTALEQTLAARKRK